MRALTLDDNGELAFCNEVAPNQVVGSLGFNDDDVPELVALTTVRTEHSYGAPVFFKPSLQEVLDQIPAEVLELLAPDAFSIAIAGDGTAPEAFTEDGSRHRGVVTLYRFAT